ncbi:Hypothetical protein PACV_436 [Pacmanvirus A23]|uniref:Hypothetical protein n=1 Tax=Pacmanvirus A23 TaxID=1932881 RepID=UPI000A0927B4|nr:Hypothetical protein B9W72_gp432 [Pacmanvirus A23]SIP86149.1 Hypothetical protein PACV_436 [Pacmanvirus A23]
MEQIHQTTIHDLPIEVLEKVINPFCVVDKLVCRLWNVVSCEMFDLAFKKHKASFKASLDEICSIRYEVVKLRDDDIITGYYSIPENNISILTEVRSGKYMSIRQYKNKVATFILKNKSICHKKAIVNKIKTMSFKTQTIFYNYVDDLNERFKGKIKIVPGDNHYQYDARFTKSFGLPDEIYGSLNETQLKRRWQTRVRCLIGIIGDEKYHKYHCLVKPS